MQQNNTVYLKDKVVSGVVVSSDREGNNILMSALKFNRLVSVTSARHYFNKNTVLVRDSEVKDALIVSDCHGNNVIKTMDEIKVDGDEECNVFMEVLHRVHSERGQASIEKYLEQKRQSLQDKLVIATELYMTGNYMRALECYNDALTMIESDNYPDEFRLEKDDLLRIKYALVLSYIGVNTYGPLKTACEMLNSLILTYGAIFPSLYYTLGQAKIKLNLYESARISLEKGVSAVNECTVLSRVLFPASNQVIPDTECVSLRDKFASALQLCKNAPRPDVRCCYRMCIADTKAIYFNSPSFIGYVNVTCSERCHFNYHRSCWKIKLKSDRVKKPSTILKQSCTTDDCNGVIAEIKIYDQRLKVNAAIKTKNDGEPNASDNNGGRRSEVVESRIYKAQFQLPNPMVRGSNLKPDAPEFTPGKVENITLRLKNPIKTGASVFDGIGDEGSSASINKEVKIDSSKASNLKVNVLEFVPAQKVAKDDAKIKEDKVKIIPSNFRVNLLFTPEQVETQNVATGLSIKEDKVRTGSNVTNSKIKEDKVKTDSNITNSQIKKEKVKIVGSITPNNFCLLFTPERVEKQIKQVKTDNVTEEKKIKEVKTENIIQSDLKVDVLEFIPSQVKTETKKVVKADLKTNEEEVKTDNNITNSNLKVDVPEFLPSQIEVQIKEEVKDDSSVTESNIKEEENSNLNVDVPEFLPSQVEIQIKEEVKDDSSVTSLNIKEVKNANIVTDSNIQEEEVKTASNVTQSNLNVDVPEFLPLQTTPAASTEVDLTKWSINAESTLDNATDIEQPTLQVDSDDSVTDSSEWPVDPALLELVSYYTDIVPQTWDAVPAATTPADEPSVIETEHKSISTDPVETHSTASQCHADTSTQHTQTDVKLSDILSQNEVRLLKYQISNLRYALYQAEDHNNQLLLCYKRLNKANQQSTTERCTQTHESVEKRQKNCLKWIHDTCSPNICHADVLQSNNQKQDEEIKELKASLRLERDCFHECKRKYCNEISSLKNNISDLESKLAALHNEYLECQQNNTAMEVNKILLEQIQCSKNFYLPYLKSFEDKCKHMIWELEDLHSMTTADATPSKSEIEENLRLWRAALLNVEEHQITIMTNYETLFGNITSQQPTAEFKMPAQKLFVEPPNIILRYFKPMLIANRRLEQDYCNQMNSFYRILNSSYPAMYQPVQSNQNADSAERNGTVDCSSNGNNTAAAAGGEDTKANMTGATPKINKMRQSRSVLEPETPPPCPQPKPQTKRTVPDVVGFDALIQRLQSQFPLTDGSVITEALFSIRGRHGGLTGMSSKEIVAEVKKYIRDRQRASISGTSTPVTIVASPWNIINTPVQWNNDNQDRNCTICFDHMPPKISVKLKCQHMFHTKCIKTWLQSNSICPICRSFTTLDDEFPPLK